MLKECKHCNAQKEQDLFVKSKLTKSGYRGICKECFNLYYRVRRIEKHELVRTYEKKFHLRRRLKYEYNLTEEEYNNHKNSQNGVCPICLSSTKKLVIDHCHNTGKVRGLLCTNCNTGLGQFKDNIASLRRAEEYLNGS